MRNKQDKGAIAILMAILAVVIVGIAALAIDMVIAAASASQHHHTAEFAALAALQRYLTSDETTYDAKLDDAVLSAQAVTRLNIPFIAGQPFFEDPTNLQDDLAEAGAASGNENGEIIPGSWHFEEPKPDCASWPDHTKSCPCPGGTWVGTPCFEQVANNERANAIRVNLNLHPTSGIKTLFAQVFGQERITFANTATASLVPRHGVFLVDMSPSVVMDTHRGTHPTVLPDEEKALYGYRTQDVFAGCPTPNPVDPLLFQNYMEPASAFFYWNKLLAGPRPAGDIVPTMHYKWAENGADPEFLCQEYSQGTSARPQGAGLPDEGYFLDQVVAPEPLTGILNSIHSAFEVFSDRAVSSDLVGFLGFDDDIPSVRKLDLITPTPDVASKPSGTDDFVDFFIATDTSNINNKVQKGLFPRRYGKTGSGPLTDIPFALASANNMLASATGAQRSQSFVVLFTDGKSNCHCPPGDPLCSNPNIPADCANNQTVYTNSMLRLQEVIDEMANNKVALHVFLIGESVAPHTLVLKGESGCMWEEEARYTPSGSTDYTPLTYPDYLGDGGDITTANSANPLYLANQLYNAAAETNGLWAPIRKCCDTAPLGDCDDISGYLDSYCDAFPLPIGSPIPAVVWGTPSSIFLWELESFSHQYDSATGRLICDPWGRTETEQVQDYMDTVMADSPFLLVE